MPQSTNLAVFFNHVQKKWGVVKSFLDNDKEIAKLVLWGIAYCHWCLIGKKKSKKTCALPDPLMVE